MSKTDNKGQFKKGTSGNPAGRPRGSRNKTTLAYEQTMHEAGPQLISTIVEQALNGDRPSQRLVLERISPVRKEQLIHLDFPPLKSAADLPNLSQKVTNAVIAGEIAPGQGESLAKILTSHANILELVEFDERLKDTEECAKDRNSFDNTAERFIEIIKERKS